MVNVYRRCYVTFHYIPGDNGPGSTSIGKLKYQAWFLSFDIGIYNTTEENICVLFRTTNASSKGGRHFVNQCACVETFLTHNSLYDNKHAADHVG